MAKCYSLQHYRKFYVSLLTLMFSMLAITSIKAQTDIAIGTGTVGNTTTTYPCPLQDFYEGSRMQYLYLASELSAAGMSPGNINAIKYTVTTLGTAGLIEQHTIKMGATATASLTATSWETVGNALYGPADYQPVAGLNTFTFTTPFFWNGTDNIVIEVCGGEPGNATGTWYTVNPVVPWTTGLAFNGSHNYRADNQGNLCGTATTTNTGTQTTRPNITFNWTPASPCAGTPVAGTAVANPATVCLGIPFNLSLSGVTIASGLTYQWQSSPDNITFTNLPGATTSNFSTTQLTTTYYRAIVTCTNGGATATSTSVQVFSPTAVSGTFTINSALPTGGTNFQSFNDAYDYIKCGINGPVTFNVNAASGPYAEQLIMIPVPGASATNTVTFNGNGRTINYLATNTNERAVIKLNGADHIRFDSLVITALGTTTAQYGFGVHLTNDADSNVVSNCVVNIASDLTSTNYAGIVMSASNTSAVGTGNTLSDGNRFTGNTITGGYYGITSVGSTTAANRDNVISGNTIKDFYSYGVYINGNFNTKIDSNLITRPTRTTVTTFYGVYVTSLNVSLNISRNTITDPFGGNLSSTSAFYGVYFTGVDALGGLENKVINNQVYGLNGNGEQNGFYNSSSDNVWYQHNTLLMNGDGGTGAQLTRGFYQITTAAGIRLENNIIVIARQSSGAKYCIYFATTASDITSNYNDLYLNPIATNAFTGFYTAARATLTDWRTASTQDANSVANNPLFINALNGNLQPTNAAIDNLGTTLGITIDILGATRSATTPDMGAYEFTPGNCTAPPTPGTAVVTPDVVCVNSNVNLSVTSNSIGLGQTYQWQSATAIGGPYTNVGGSVTNPVINITATSTLYYRVGVTCTGNTQYSASALLTVNPALPAGTYTINAGLPTGGTNYISFNAAKVALTCGIAGPVVFNVVSGSGPYNEQLVLDSIAGTSAVNTITFNGNGNTIAFSSSDNLERAVIKLRGADHIIFDSLTINAEGPNTYGWGVQLYSNADSNTIRNCTILTTTSSTSTNNAGIVISNSESFATSTGNTWCDGNKILNNSITGGYYAVTLVGGTTSTTDPVKNNIISGNTISDFYFYGIYLSGNQNTIVEANTITRPTRSAVSTFYGIYVAGSSVGMKINRNRITNPFGGNPSSTSLLYGIYIIGCDATPGSENIVSNNLFYNLNGSGTQYMMYNSSSNYALYYHNTIALNEPGNTSTNSSFGFYQITTADGIDLKNNIFSLNRGGSTNVTAIYQATSSSTITSNYNDFYRVGTNTRVGYNGTYRITLADWQAATSQDANSLATNPFYSNPAGGNYRPMSPVLDNKGTPVGISIDIENDPRSLTVPDIGAYEFTVPPCTNPPTAGTAVAIPNSGICLGTSIELSLDGNSIGSGQTYQWQYSTTATGPWTDLGAIKMFPDTTIFASSSYYYRAVVTCNNGTPVISGNAQVTLNPAFLAGTYTIDKTIPASAVNFTSFGTAVAALDCGITGPVFFDVAPNTYTEQIRMKSVAGTSPTVRVTFRSANGDPASVILTNAPTVAANYTLLLDSASYITYKNMTIEATGSTYGRVLVMDNTASFDSIVNCRINAPVSTSTSNNITGIYADGLRGEGNTIKNNIISNGSSGIYFRGSGTTALTYDHVIDSNTVNGSYYYGMYLGNTGRIQVTKNMVNVTMPRNSTSYAMYSTNSDSAYQYVANNINIEGLTTTTSYGMYFTGCNGGVGKGARIAGNTITALTGNTGTLYGLYQTASTYNKTVNNVINILTSGTTSYGAYMTGGGGCTFQNNTVVNSSASTAVTNVAAYLTQTSGNQPSLNIQNNILSHLGGGRAMYTTNLNFIYSDYNTFYTTGSTLIQWNTGNAYSTLQAWRDTSYWDLSSIAVQPALISATNLRPDVANPLVWAIHGRGNQVPGNNYDFDNNPRPTTLTTGVPDMGAFEFLPTALPTLLTAIPATPAPGTTQTFMYGTDTVMKITYAPGAPVPASINLRRYSGVLPTGLTAAQKSMYFYTDVDVPAQGAYKYTLQQFYVDSWQGFIPKELNTRLGRFNASNAWVLNKDSKVDAAYNIISDTSLVYMDRFTGLTDSSVVAAGGPVVLPSRDSSNQGTRFWVGYGHHQNFGSGNTQDMVLYFSAEQAANVTVKVNGTNYVRTYAVPANSVITSAIVPKYGLIDARLTEDGKSVRGISIESDVPIVAYAHIYASTTSEAAMLLPVGTYGFEYTALTTTQNYASNTYSWFYVISDNDSTKVTITPSNLTLGGSPAGVPFDVYLNKGEVYQALGAIISGSDGYDLTGSTIRSIANDGGRCFPIAVFSGSSRTNIGCGTSNPSASGDNIIEQNFPLNAWGKKYLVAPTSSSTGASSLHTNIYRVAVKNPATVVTRNGVPLTGLVNNFYYQFESNTADVIEGNNPIIVAQIMASSGFCPNNSGGGDPAMVYVSPVEQGIKRVGLYRNTQSAITNQYVTMIIPTPGLSSLTIDGSSTFDYTYAHTAPGYSVVVKRWNPASNAQVIVQSDSAFTLITYGLGSVESYAYNGGTLVKTLNALPSIDNTLSSATVADYTCVNAPFKFNILLSSKPTVLTWKFSALNNLITNTDVVQSNPVPVDSVFSNGTWFYKYRVNTDYRFTSAGTFYVPIFITDPSTIEGCNNTLEVSLKVVVIPAPAANFTGTLAACLGQPVTLSGVGSTSNGIPINSYNWTFGDATTGTGQNQVKTYAAVGTYNVALRIIANDGCVGDTTKQVVISPIPTVAVVQDTLVVCGNSPATFTVSNPVAGNTYRWYAAATGGTALATGTSFTTPAVLGTVSYFVEATSAATCVSTRKQVVASLLPDLVAPVAKVDTASIDQITFSWLAVPGAVRYEVSVNGSATWITPSSGTTGLTHTVTGLLPLTDVSIRVRAIGTAVCQQATSLSVTGKTKTDQIFIPNAFSPNGDGTNDLLLVYGYSIQSLRFMVFNQWGEKIFESNNQAAGWNGTHKGQPQPSGVYMYVCEAQLRDGTKIVRKGSINLVR